MTAQILQGEDGWFLLIPDSSVEVPVKHVFDLASERALGLSVVQVLQAEVQRYYSGELRAEPHCLQRNFLPEAAPSPRAVSCRRDSRSAGRFAVSKAVERVTR